jgi:hypothetical protein
MGDVAVVGETERDVLRRHHVPLITAFKFALQIFENWAHDSSCNASRFIYSPPNNFSMKISPYSSHPTYFILLFHLFPILIISKFAEKGWRKVCSDSEFWPTLNSTNFRHSGHD